MQNAEAIINSYVWYKLAFFMWFWNMVLYHYYQINTEFQVLRW